MRHDSRFDHSFAARAMAVRAVLTRLRQESVLQGLTQDAAECCELVLAEAMNNIVEHAYGEGGGFVRLTLLRGRHRVICRLLDHGRPMPGLTVPSLPLRDIATESVSGDLLDEGGYGWSLIHCLSQRLHYRRTNGTNRLYIVVPAKDATA